MDSNYCPDPDWCPAAPDPHGHRTDDTYFYRRANSDAGPGCDTNADTIRNARKFQVADHLPMHPAGAVVPDAALDEHPHPSEHVPGRDDLG